MSKIDSSKLLISSAFYTVQGEGISSGVPSYFVRLGICNLTCGMSRAFTNLLAKEQKLEDGEILKVTYIKKVRLLGLVIVHLNGYGEVKIKNLIT